MLERKTDKYVYERYVNANCTLAMFQASNHSKQFKAKQMHQLFCNLLNKVQKLFKQNPKCTTFLRIS